MENKRDTVRYTGLLCKVKLKGKTIIIVIIQRVLSTCKRTEEIKIGVLEFLSTNKFELLVGKIKEFTQYGAIQP